MSLCDDVLQILKPFYHLFQKCLVLLRGGAVFNIYIKTCSRLSNPGLFQALTLLPTL